MLTLHYAVLLGGDIVEVISPLRVDMRASRHLSKCGDFGYIVIMQTLDASALRKYLEFNGLWKAVFAHNTSEIVCV